MFEAKLSQRVEDTVQECSSFGKLCASIVLVSIDVSVQILKNAISIHTRYEPGVCNFPKIEIAIKNVPNSQDSEPLELRVEGLNVESVFRFPPGR